MTGNPNPVVITGASLGSMRKPDYDTSIGAEVGGPLIKDRLFFWAGFAPRFNNSHVYRLTYAQVEDPIIRGTAQLDANGQPIVNELEYWRARINESRQTYNYAATVDFIPRPEHRLTLAVMGTPSFNKQMRSVFGPGLDAVSSPSWARESLTKTNTDVTARWVSKLFDRRWIIEANAGLHREDFNNRSPDAALNALNQLEYHNTNLWDLERAPGCEPIPRTEPDDGRHRSTFQPCPVGVGGNPYHTGGFGLARQYTGQRWMGEMKSTHLVNAGGQHEIKYGVRMEYSQFEQDRYYSGPLGIARPAAAAPERRRPGRRAVPVLQLDAPSSRCRRVRSRPASVRRAAAVHRPAALAVLPGQPEGQRVEPVERVLPAGQLQPVEAAQPDHQPGRAPRDAAHDRHLRQGVPRHQQPGAALRRHLRSDQRRPVEDLGVLRPLLRGDPDEPGRALLRRRGDPAPQRRAAVDLRAARRVQVDGQRRVEPVRPARDRRHHARHGGGRHQPVQQRLELPGAGQPQGPVPQRDRRDRRARDHRGPDGSRRLHPPLDRQGHRRRHRRPERQLRVRARQPGRHPARRRSTPPSNEVTALQGDGPERPATSRRSRPPPRRSWPTSRGWPTRPSRSGRTTRSRCR